MNTQIIILIIIISSINRDINIGINSHATYTVYYIGICNMHLVFNQHEHHVIQLLYNSLAPTDPLTMYRRWRNAPLYVDCASCVSVSGKLYTTSVQYKLKKTDGLKTITKDLKISLDNNSGPPLTLSFQLVSGLYCY